MQSRVVARSFWLKGKVKARWLAYLSARSLVCACLPPLPLNLILQSLSPPTSARHQRPQSSHHKSSVNYRACSVISVNNRSTALDHRPTAVLLRSRAGLHRSRGGPHRTTSSSALICLPRPDPRARGPSVVGIHKEGRRDSFLCTRARYKCKQATNEPRVPTSYEYTDKLRT